MECNINIWIQACLWMNQSYLIIFPFQLPSRLLQNPSFRCQYLYSQSVFRFFLSILGIVISLNAVMFLTNPCLKKTQVTLNPFKTKSPVLSEADRAKSCRTQIPSPSGTDWCARPICLLFSRLHLKSLFYFCTSVVPLLFTLSHAGRISSHSWVLCPLSVVSLYNM